MKPITCARLRQGDEWYCAICHTRWDIGDTAPPCNPVEIPTENKYKPMKRKTFTQKRKRAKRFQGYR